MSIVLEYKLASGMARKVWLHPGQILRFGKSTRADVVIDDLELGDVHFVVTGTADDWLISSIGRENPVFANGQLVNGYVLCHGDELQAGRTLFRIAIDGKAIAPVQEVPEDDRSAKPVDETQPLTFAVQQLASKVVDFKLQVKDSQVAELFSLLLEKEPWSGCKCYVTFNAKRFGKASQSWQPAGNDLFEYAPDEIRATDSLAVTLLDKPADAQVLAEARTACRSDAACLIFSPLPMEDFLESHKIVWAWFSRPSIFAQQVTLGSSMLAHKLVLNGEFVVLFNPGTNAGLRIVAQVTSRDQLQQCLQPIRLRTS